MKRLLPIQRAQRAHQAALNARVAQQKAWDFIKNRHTIHIRNQRHTSCYVHTHHMLVANHLLALKQLQVLRYNIGRMRMEGFEPPESALRDCDTLTGILEKFFDECDAEFSFKGLVIP